MNIFAIICFAFQNPVTKHLLNAVKEKGSEKREREKDKWSIIREEKRGRTSLGSRHAASSIGALLHVAELQQSELFVRWLLDRWTRAAAMAITAIQFKKRIFIPQKKFWNWAYP